MTIIWCVVPEIWSTTDRIFVILDCFLSLCLPMDQENKNFEKMKKMPRDIIILHMHTINDNHIMYGSWDIIFCHFTPLATRKMKILKKRKNPWRYYHFTHVYDKWQPNDLWFLRYGVQWTNFFVILDSFLALLPP